MTAVALSVPAVGHAADVGVSVDGCPELADAVAAALRLEVGEGWRVVEGDTPAARVRVELTACDDARWTIRVDGPDGALLSGPEDIAMEAFTEPSRVRVAALWAAERLPLVPVTPPARTLDDPRVGAEPIPPPPAAPESRGERAEVGPGDSELPRAVVVASLGAGYVLDPAQLAETAGLARLGAFAQVLDWLLVGGSLEGGALFEPFSHVQPFLRLCAEPHALFDLGDVAVGIGPKLCLSVSRHLWAVVDRWASGVALGGFARAQLAVADGLAVGVRFDADGWERDLLVEAEDVAFASRSDPTLPWVGVFAAALELQIR